ncbi:hypothetical protein AHF37_09489 [Paragonimus kellicotti]|nr:hypothetical protein AHF37_09489 [Paragonimus kellicotti]
MHLHTASSKTPVCQWFVLMLNYHTTMRKNVSRTKKRNLTVREDSIPPSMMTEAKNHRAELIECLANADESIADAFLTERELTETQLKTGLRRAVLSRQFVPVLVGPPFKVLLDATRSDDLNFIGLAFKLEASRFGQLTYMRVYQGCLHRGDVVVNTRNKRRLRVPRLGRLNVTDFEDLDAVYAGDIAALFGVDCFSGDTLVGTKMSKPLTMESIFIPEPVVSMSITPTDKMTVEGFSKGLGRFTREDPTFRLTQDPESGQVLVSGMGELHLEIYAQRLAREYNAPCELGKPRVAFRETLAEPFDDQSSLGLVSCPDPYGSFQMLEIVLFDPLQPMSLSLSAATYALIVSLTLYTPMQSFTMSQTLNRLANVEQTVLPRARCTSVYLRFTDFKPQLREWPCVSVRS